MLKNVERNGSNAERVPKYRGILLQDTHVRRNVDHASQAMNCGMFEGKREAGERLAAAGRYGQCE